MQPNESMNADVTMEDVEIYHANMTERFEDFCLTTVVICGPPPPPRRFYNDLLRDSVSFKARMDWVDSMEALCLERFKLAPDKVGDFIHVFEIWWKLQKEDEGCSE